MLFLRLVALLRVKCEGELTHVIDLHEVVSVMTIVNTLHADRKGAGFTEVFHWLVFMQVARDEVRQLD